MEREGSVSPPRCDLTGNFNDDIFVPCNDFQQIDYEIKHAVKHFVEIQNNSENKENDDCKKASTQEVDSLKEKVVEYKDENKKYVVNSLKEEVKDEDKTDVPDPERVNRVIQRVKFIPHRQSTSLTNTNSSKFGNEKIFPRRFNKVERENSDKYLIIKVIRIPQQKEEAKFQFRVKRTAQLGKLKKRYSDSVIVPLYLLRFLYNGVRISDKHTPDMLEMESGDVIEVYNEIGSWKVVTS